MSWFNPFSWKSNFKNKAPVAYNEIPRDQYKILSQHPLARKLMIETSIQQDIEGSYYHGMLNTLANHCLGPCPILVGQSTSYKVNTQIEDRWTTFTTLNEIGSALRLLRRSAARTGIGIGIPIVKETGDQVRLGINVIPTEKLQNPLGGGIKDRWFEGIKYNDNYEPVEISLDTGESYKVKDILLWWKRKDECRIAGVPECGPALCILPSIKRYLDAIIRSAEFRAAIPLAVRLDPMIWGKEAAESVGMPKGQFKYEPGMIPTLPPGTSLEGIPVSGIEDEDNAVLLAMVGAAARCINMPLNLATGDSSRHNMASSQVDFGPWKETVLIDRQDFSVVLYKFINMWLTYGSKVPGYFSRATNQLIESTELAYTLSYRSPFNHPDPMKVSNSLMTDLISGVKTLTQIHTEEGRNPRRVIEREAQTLGKTYEEMCNLYLTNRSPSALQVLNLLQVPEDNNDQKK